MKELTTIRATPVAFAGSTVTFRSKLEAQTFSLEAIQALGVLELGKEFDLEAMVTRDGTRIIDGVVEKAVLVSQEPARPAWKKWLESIHPGWAVDRLLKEIETERRES